MNRVSRKKKRLFSESLRKFFKRVFVIYFFILFVFFCFCLLLCFAFSRSVEIPITVWKLFFLLRSKRSSRMS